eukprot:TRINITY_DN11545_c0_g1_i2.p1 TRINITY_DN11545_c0_g1~~TRINITY_DN11545_c0_g1_i2.p1  ORF type:complete len:680 (-),score=121.39 TRINITY_DN11545_c0_g1_i2:41-1909(-)
MDCAGLEKDGPVKVRKLPIGVILLVELCERLTYYTLAGTQKTYYQNQLGKPASDAAALNSVFSMLCYMWCVPGGLLADSIGRYKTIISAGIVYAAGAILVAISVIYSLQHSLAGMFTVGCMLLIPLGTGGIKPNIANFGADQIGDETESQRQCQKTYFSLFYLSINVGVLFAFGYVTTITTAGIPGFVSEQEGYSFAYGLGAVCMAFAVILFVSSTSCYKIIAGSGLGPAMLLVRYLCNSVTRGGGPRAVLSAIGWLCLPVFFFVTLVAALLPDEESGVVEAFVDPCGSGAAAADSVAPARLLHGGGGGGGGGIKGMLNYVALGLGTACCLLLIGTNLRTRWVQPLKEEDEDFNVKDAQKFFAAIPMIIIVNIGFNLAYNAMNNAFPSQACQMNTMIGGSQLNGAFFNLADAIAIIVFTPIFESCLFPLIARCQGGPVRFGQKIIAGLVIAALANLVAAILEIQRRSAPFLCDADVGFSKCAPGYTDNGAQGTRMRDMSAFWIFIPFGLMGIAEILVNPVMYCFSYEAAPVKVRSLMQAINLLFNGSVSNAFTAVVSQATYPNDLDTGHLENYYYINIFMAFVGLIAYFLMTRCFGGGKELRREVRREEFEIYSDNSGSDSN